MEESNKEHGELLDEVGCKFRHGDVVPLVIRSFAYCRSRRTAP